MQPEDKIVGSADDMERIVERLKAEGKTIIMTNGCFDLLHVGHTRCLEGAKKVGDILVVAVNSDSSVRSYKGPGNPINPENERMEVLASLQCVDYVFPFSESTVDSVLLRLKPDYHAKGTDYTEETVPERDTVLSYGGRIVITGDPKNHATSDIIEKIRGSRTE
jgi:rfaE bifunctional protein nucleotidyltransferase chain/domain